MNRLDPDFSKQNFIFSSKFEKFIDSELEVVGGEVRKNSYLKKSTTCVFSLD